MNSCFSFSFKSCLLSGLFDQIIHSADNIDIRELFKHLHAKVNEFNISYDLKFSICNERIEKKFYMNFILQVMLGLPALEGTNPASCFPSSVIGYEAACYSRIWSEV